MLHNQKSMPKQIPVFTRGNFDEPSRRVPPEEYKDLPKVSVYTGNTLPEVPNFGEPTDDEKKSLVDKYFF